MAGSYRVERRHAADNAPAAHDLPTRGLAPFLAPRTTSPFGGGPTCNNAVTPGGNVVCIDRGEGVVTTVVPLSTPLVAVGDTVAPAILQPEGSCPLALSRHFRVIRADARRVGTHIAAADPRHRSDVDH